MEETLKKIANWGDPWSSWDWKFLGEDRENKRADLNFLMNQAALQWIFKISKLAITQWAEEAAEATLFIAALRALELGIASRLHHDDTRFCWGFTLKENW